jgi:RNA polymerase sigma-70 factor (ECF subfamily)
MKSGSALNFETLVELYYQPVFTFAVKLCGKLEQALELTQHTFCLALNHENYWGETRCAKNWLFTLLFREFLKERRLETEPTSLFALPRHPSKARATTPFVEALIKVRRELRAPLVLFYAKDLSFSQIADHLGISVESVLTLLSKGREELSLALASSVAGACQARALSRRRWPSQQLPQAA